MKKLKIDSSENILTLSANEKANVKKILSEEGNDVKAEGGPIKTVAIFIGLLLAFTTILLPIIDKIFPDAPTVETSSTSQ